MSLAEQSGNPGRPMARDVIMGRDPEILDDIHLPSVAASIWTRVPDPHFQAWIDGLPVERLPGLKTVLPIHLAEAAVLSACEAAGTPAGPEQDMLAGDVGALVLMVAKTLRVEQVRLRLDVSGEVMCPKFHTDNVPARLCAVTGAPERTMCLKERKTLRGASGRCAQALSPCSAAGSGRTRSEPGCCTGLRRCRRRSARGCCW